MSVQIVVQLPAPAGLHWITAAATPRGSVAVALTVTVPRNMPGRGDRDGRAGVVDDPRGRRGGVARVAGLVDRDDAQVVGGVGEGGRVPRAGEARRRGGAGRGPGAARAGRVLEAQRGQAGVGVAARAREGHGAAQRAAGVGHRRHGGHGVVDLAGRDDGRGRLSCRRRRWRSRAGRRCRSPASPRCRRTARSRTSTRPSRRRPGWSGTGRRRRPRPSRRRRRSSRRA